MTGFFNKLEAKLMPVANFFGQQRHLLAIRDGVVSAMPLTIIGSIFLILACPPVSPENMPDIPLLGDFLLAWYNWANANMSAILAPFSATMAILSLFVCVGSTYSLSSHYGKKPLNYIIANVSIYILVCAPVTDGAIPTAAFDGKGILLAAFVALIGTEIMNFVENKGWTFKMPAGVPPIVANSFASLFPFGINLILFYSLSLICQATTGQLLPDVFFNLFSGIKASVDNLISVTLLTGVENLLFGFGVHPTTVVGPVLDPLEAMNIAENANLVANGLQATQIYTQPFWAFYAALGGGGATLGLAVLTLKAKSKQVKDVGKVAFIPSLFNINEPLIFGLPIFLNPILIIPFMIAPMVNIVIGWLATASGLVNMATIAAPWTSPAPIGAMIATLDWKAFVLVIIMLLINMVIYYPFLRMFDKAKYAEEQAEGTPNAATE